MDAGLDFNMSLLISSQEVAAGATGTKAATHSLDTEVVGQASISLVFVENAEEEPEPQHQTLNAPDHEVDAGENVILTR